MEAFDLFTCRRFNYIQAAMVQAAISIQRTHGTESAIAVMEAEALPHDVIDRVLAPFAQRRRWPYSALERPEALQSR